MIIRFSSLARMLMISMMWVAAPASISLVGSSRKISWGCFISVTARESRRFCYPERPLKKAFPTFVSAQTNNPIFFSIFSTFSFFSALLSSARYRSARS